ncbi:hypothetical protein [Streptomyces alanosinicus]|uniref:Uncharacterized protein n=1 Tax=Streptomyces alanosinicus TaxID=68171 RepID=A0A918YJS9_9ACTN|nr:hypothetical protein [Streptomyces alanosinicus]GHE05636.1 hypothetical protein GCM10010339_42310 [Streptomyces alanosinicus]
MSARRAVLLVTGAATGILAIAFAVVGSRRADHIATLVSALVAVVGLGVAVGAAAVPAMSGRRSIRVSGTGAATAAGSGSAVSGAAVSVANGTETIEVSRSGTAEARDDGEATSGIRRL